MVWSIERTWYHVASRALCAQLAPQSSSHGNQRSRISKRRRCASADVSNHTGKRHYYEYEPGPVSVTGSRSTDLTLKHLIAANTLVILSQGVPQTMAAFGLKHFLNDFGCKLVFYVHTVGKGVSIGSTCLLSVFQAIIISPRNSRWTKLKAKAPRFMRITNIFSWILHRLNSPELTGQRSEKNFLNVKAYVMINEQHENEK
ncbi:hypothetical protein HPG69_007587 [Diceros bicornis minor]|uniref:Vomeronasal type-1 receptor n=1 Tax=Diceros bicornis minor TaxID=77932 RepID=A0A7J7EFD8_DICBM|nr:hypothetical protein HPG69_007587 [Diceros bicornis minor]